MTHANLNGEPYCVLPAVDLTSNAGSMGPGEREQRYRPFTEPVRLHSKGIL